MEVVAVLGASSDENRYSYKAIEMLKEYGHRPLPVNPREEKILGEKVYPSLANIDETVDTLTMYVNAAKSSKLQNEIIKLHPKRVIFNPGAENPELSRSLIENGIKVENACTLVLLRTDQF